MEAHSGVNPSDRFTPLLALPASVLCFIGLECCSLLAKTIAHAAHRLDQFGIGWIFFELFAQPTHVDIDGTCISHVIVSPYMGQQGIPAHHDAPVAQKIDQHLKLLGLDDDFLSLTKNMPAKKCIPYAACLQETFGR